MGETRVDLVHLLEDLRDAYPGSLEESIITELVANALDSGARSLELRTDPATATLLAIDDGRGMTRQELTRYHDLATTSKRRGKGIGFAGVGIKLGLLACEEVVTETRRGRNHMATRWRLSNRNRAPWGWVEPPGVVEDIGTAIQLRVSNPLSHLLDRGFLEAVLLRNFQPLFEPEFIDILTPYYPNGLSLAVDGQVVVGPIRRSERVDLALRIGRQRKPSAVGYLARYDEPLPEPERGLAISTLGKVIRRGWDWIGLNPADGERLEGLIEVPSLAEALTLNKGDFLRHGERGALFLSYRQAIQEVVSAQLAAWGESAPPRRQRRTRPMERDLTRVLGALAEDFPLLSALTDRKVGGQRRLALGDPLRAGEVGGAAALQGDVFGAATAAPEQTEHSADDEAELPDAAPGAGSSADPDGNHDPHRPDRTPPTDGPDPDESGANPESDGDAARRPASASVPVGALPGAGRRKRPATISLSIRFETLPGDTSLARLADATVRVNDAHPAYRRALGSRSDGYHIAVAVASALAPLTVEAGRTQEFVNAFLARWGEG